MTGNLPTEDFSLTTSQETAIEDIETSDDEGEDVSSALPDNTPEELRAMGHQPMSALHAIRAHCLDCCGGLPREVRYCAAVQCPSWPFRMGKSPWKQKRTLTEEQRVKLAANLARHRQMKVGDGSNGN